MNTEYHFWVSVCVVMRLVPDDTLHKGTNRPPFVTRVSLTLDIFISLYLINDFSFLFSNL